MQEGGTNANIPTLFHHSNIHKSNNRHSNMHILLDKKIPIKEETRTTKKKIPIYLNTFLTGVILWI